jgi:uncharacterized membrane protein
MAGASSNLPNPAQSEIACPRCETVMPGTAAFCPGCGQSMKPVTPAERRVAAGAYFTLLPAVVFLFLPAFRKSRFVRFHAWQSILLWTIFLVASITGILVSNIAAAVALLLLGIIGSLAMFFLWVVLSFKAWQGERFELPVFGALADRLVSGVRP